jgi:hypothetical protein
VSRFHKIFPDRKPPIAMAHVPALPGTPLYDASAGLSGAVSSVRRDAEVILVSGKMAGARLHLEPGGPSPREAVRRRSPLGLIWLPWSSGSSERNFDAAHVSAEKSGGSPATAAPTWTYAILLPNPSP